MLCRSPITRLYLLDLKMNRGDPKLSRYEYAIVLGKLGCLVTFWREERL